MAKTTCSRGHVFSKTKDMPVCPVCWPGRYKKDTDVPKLGAPATRALLNQKITTLAQLSRYSEAEILALHGIGTTSMPVLRRALKAKGLSFRK